MEFRIKMVLITAVMIAVVSGMIFIFGMPYIYYAFHRESFIDYDNPYTQKCYMMEKSNCLEAHLAGSDYQVGVGAVNVTGDYMQSQTILNNESCNEAWKFCYTH